MQPRRAIGIAHSDDFTFQCARRRSPTTFGCRARANPRMWPRALRTCANGKPAARNGAPMHPPALGHAVFESVASAASLTGRPRRHTAVAVAETVSARRECSRSADTRQRGGARVARCAAPRVPSVAPVIRSTARRPEVRSAGARRHARWRRARRDATCPGLRRR